MTDRAPLVPADVDLRDFAYMPLDVRRLRDSDLASDETPEACWAALLLWCASWHQVPAGSIPNNDGWHAKQTGYAARGRVDKAWAEVRDGALRGWIACSDGRLYHPVVAEKAREAWQQRLQHAHKRECDRLRKENKARAEKRLVPLEIPSFDEWNSARPPPVSDGIPPEKALKGREGKGSEGNGIDSKALPPAAAADPPTEPPPPTVADPPLPPPPPPLSNGNGTTERANEIAGLLRKRGANLTASDPRVRDWASSGVSDAQLLTALDSAVEARHRRADPTPVNAGFLDTLLGDVRAKRPTYDVEALQKL